MDRCEPLKEYSEFIGCIRSNLKTMDKGEKEKRQVLSEAELNLYYQCLIPVRHRNRFLIFAD